MGLECGGVGGVGIGKWGGFDGDVEFGGGANGDIFGEGGGEEVCGFAGEGVGAASDGREVVFAVEVGNGGVGGVGGFEDGDEGVGDGSVGGFIGDNAFEAGGFDPCNIAVEVLEGKFFGEFGGIAEENVAVFELSHNDSVEVVVEGYFVVSAIFGVSGAGDELGVEGAESGGEEGEVGGEILGHGTVGGEGIGVEVEEVVGAEDEAGAIVPRVIGCVGVVFMSSGFEHSFVDGSGESAFDVEEEEAEVQE